MLILGGVSITSQYLCYKYRLLRFAKKPPSYDQMLHNKAMGILPWSVVIHLMIGIYMYGCDSIFPNTSSLISVSAVN